MELPYSCMEVVCVAVLEIVAVVWARGGRGQGASDFGS